MVSWTNKKVATSITIVILILWLVVLVVLLGLGLAKQVKLELLYGWLLPLPFVSLSVIGLLQLTFFFEKYKHQKKQKTAIFFGMFFVGRYVLHLLPVIIAFVTEPKYFNPITTITSTLFFPFLKIVLSFVWLPLEYHFISLIQKFKKKYVVTTGDSFKNT